MRTDPQLLSRKRVAGVHQERGGVDHLAVGLRDKIQNGHFRIRTRRGLVAATITIQAIVVAAGLGLTLRLFQSDFTHFIASGASAADWVDVSSLRDDLMLVSGSTGVLILGLSALTSMALMRRYDTNMERVNRYLEEEVARRMGQALKTRHALIFGLAKLADYRDTDTGRHLERISRYCEILARELRHTIGEIDAQWIDQLKLASALHDIGKVGIPDRILLKPGALTPEERTQMQLHPIIGADTLIAIRRRLGDDELVNMGIQIALEHHEKWDGSGYPFGLRESQITLPARIVALADVYDAMTSKRVYKDAVGHAEVVKQIVASRGTHFDPQIVDAFIRVQDKFERIRRELASNAACPGGLFDDVGLDMIDQHRKAA
jgi:HD-GYP domain-containing protein (c-di-GMP phosphodiesterase class II)